MARAASPAPLADETPRTRFVEESDRNFSVIAPAGVGKTTAITRRVAHLATQDAHRETPRLPRLVVVTYTRKAADEMRRRAADELRAQGVGPGVIAAFQQAFFGTIHSFCLELLRQFGPLAGLSSHFEQATDREALWREFIQGRDRILDALPADIRSRYSRLASLRDAFALAQNLDPTLAPPSPAPPPIPVLDPLLAIPVKGPGKKGIADGQRLARQWQEAWEADPESPCPPPDFNGGSAAFKACWTEVWQPLHDWIGAAHLSVAAALARDFRAFRLARGEIDFDDMVALAAQLLDDPVAGPAIHDQGRIVILDEAQDTDQRQFDILLGVAGAQAGFRQRLSDDGPPLGRFSLVGDPQQAIYGSRADLETYLDIHERLTSTGAAEEIIFHVTMRCDEAIVATVNAIFPALLRNEPGQASFVPLQARPSAGPGTVARVQLPAITLPEKPTVDARTAAEAQAMANWLRETGCTGLGVSNWEQIGLLVPRIDWAEALARTIELAGLPIQAHSRATLRGEDPVWAWTVALIRVIACPEDAFEVTGLLREAFALSDDALAHHVQTKSHPSVNFDHFHPLSLNGDSGGTGPVADALRALRRARQATLGQPLSDGFATVLQQLQWAERLAALPEQSAEATQQGLERLRQEALLAEERGWDWAQWATRLVRALEDKLEADDPRPGHLQLLSCHKAKGLQWRVVLVPCLHRGIGQPPTRYPRLLQRERGAQPVTAMNREAHPGPKTRLQRRQDQELERLAYVTWTRARERLIFLDGSAYWDEPQKRSWAEYWQIEGANAATWTQIPEFKATVLSPNRDITLDTSAPESCLQRPRAPLPAAWSYPAYPHRVLPSSLAQHSRHTSADPGAPDAPPGHARDERDWRTEPGYPETRAEQAARAGAAYGNWWHETMEQAPWGAMRADWIAHRDDALRSCPDTKRAVTEFEQLVTSEGFAWLNLPEIIVRCELPLLWPEDSVAPVIGELPLTTPSPAPAARVFDGFIDLLARDETTGTWRVVDWKTDRVDKDPASELRKTYGPQLAAYVRAIRHMFGEPADGWLYSTRAGQWILCDETDTTLCAP